MGEQTQTWTIEGLIEGSQGDPEALGELLERYRPHLRLVSRRQINPKVAVRCSPSGIVQETFAEATNGFKRFVGLAEAEFSAWIGRTHQLGWFLLPVDSG